MLLLGLLLVEIHVRYDDFSRLAALISLVKKKEKMHLGSRPSAGCVHVHNSD